MAELIPRISEDARIMRSFDDFEEGTPEELFFSRMEAMDTTTMLPIALFLFRTTELTSERRLRALAALESWLVRRAILRLTSKNYNRTLTSLLKAIKDDAEHADEAIVRELRSSQAASAVWPADDDIRSRLEEGELYGYVGQPRVRLLLEGCELDMRDPAKTEAIALPASLSIEHALPQSWEENWPVDDADDPEVAAKNRQAHINRLGNLTLVTQTAQLSPVQCPLAEHGQRPAQQAGRAGQTESPAHQSEALSVRRVERAAHRRARRRSCRAHPAHLARTRLGHLARDTRRATASGHRLIQSERSDRDGEP